MTDSNSITLTDFFAELNNHDWFYHFSDDPKVNAAGRKAWQSIVATSELSDLHATLLKAYIDYRNGDSALPIIEEPKAAPKFNTSSIMYNAWDIARDGAKRFGGKAVDYFTQALKQAWALAIAKALPDGEGHSCFICFDRTNTNGTRTLNLPLIDAVFLGRESAQAALKILGKAFTKPFIKTSSHYNVHGNLGA